MTLSHDWQCCAFQISLHANDEQELYQDTSPINLV